MSGNGPNGGVIGVCNAASSALSSKTTTVNSTACFTRGNACSTEANLLVIAGGGGGGGESIGWWCSWRGLSFLHGLSFSQLFSL